MNYQNRTEKSAPTILEKFRFEWHSEKWPQNWQSILNCPPGTPTLLVNEVLSHPAAVSLTPVECGPAVPLLRATFFLGPVSHSPAKREKRWLALSLDEGHFVRSFGRSVSSRLCRKCENWRWSAWCTFRLLALTLMLGSANRDQSANRLILTNASTFSI